VLSGNNTEADREFSFTVSFSDGGTYDGVTSGVPFKLRGGKSRTISGIPLGVSYVVDEVEANTDGYSTTATGVSGTISAEASQATFTNTRNSAPTPKPTPVTPNKVAANPQGQTGTTPKTGDNPMLRWQVLLSVALCAVGMGVLLLANRHPKPTQVKEKRYR
ncbi:MAG: DUF5979 domain-containing protein, partial [Actinomycetia bacterium]|nr:DUF5979 domain-containing protein [Actinomycetes bacterium]